MSKYLSTRVSVRGLSVLPHVHARVCQGVPTHRYKVWAGGSGPLVGGAGLSLCIDSWGAAKSGGFIPCTSKGFWNLLNVQSKLLSAALCAQSFAARRGSHCEKGQALGLWGGLARLAASANPSQPISFSFQMERTSCSWPC